MSSTSMSGSSRQIEFKVTSERDGMSCGDFLKHSGVSRRLVTRLKRVPDGIARNGSPVRTIDILHNGDVVIIKNLDESLLEPNVTLTVPVVYEDEGVVVFDKPADMPVHPSHKHREDTLGNCFAAMFGGLTFRPLNRLDKDTSGLCAVAKSAYAAAVLNGGISKVYNAVTEGIPFPTETGNPLIKWYETADGYRIEAPIGRAAESVIRREIRADGQFAATNYTIEKESGKFALLRISLETGRTHQIRVHFSSVGRPLAGDDFYGGSLCFCGRQALHCSEMRFVSPFGGEVFLSSKLPDDMKNLIDSE